jgi:GNAT superfamily N-acetyltransferase
MRPDSKPKKAWQHLLEKKEYVILEKAENGFHKKLLATYADGEIEVWLVDGSSVRTLRDINFTAGGNNAIYGWIPENEIWIDDALSEKEINYTIFHELIEAALMSSGYDYDRSHEYASNIELSYREANEGVPEDRLEEEAQKLVGVLNEKKHKLFKKAGQVTVKPFQRKGKLIGAYTRFDPRMIKIKSITIDFSNLIERMLNERGIEVSVPEITDYGPHTDVEFYLWEKGSPKILNKRSYTRSEGIIGRYEVAFYKGVPDIHLGSLFLRKDRQGGGLGNDLIKNTIELGKKKGYKNFTMLANGDVGVYAWSIQGFDWTREITRKAIATDFSKWLKKKYLIDVQQEDFKHSWDIASFKIGDNKVGKEYFLGDGKEYFDAKLSVDSQGWKIFEHYQKLRRAKYGQQR